jgi:hypothetical protein
MKRHITAAKRLMSELRPEDIAPDQIIGAGSAVDLRKVEVVLTSTMASLNKEVIDTMILSRLSDQMSETFVINSDFDRPFFLLKESAKIFTIKDLLDIEVSEESDQPGPSWLTGAAMLAPVPGVDRILGRIRAEKSKKEELVVLHHPQGAVVNIFWLTEYLTPAGAGVPYYAVSNFSTKISVRLSSKRIRLAGSWGAQPRANAIQALHRLVQNNLAAGYNVVGYQK